MLEYIDFISKVVCNEIKSREFKKIYNEKYLRDVLDYLINNVIFHGSYYKEKIASEICGYNHVDTKNGFDSMSVDINKGKVYYGEVKTERKNINNKLNCCGEFSNFSENKLNSIKVNIKDFNLIHYGVIENNLIYIIMYNFDNNMIEYLDNNLKEQKNKCKVSVRWNYKNITEQNIKVVYLHDKIFDFENRIDPDFFHLLINEKKIVPNKISGCSELCFNFLTMTKTNFYEYFESIPIKDVIQYIEIIISDFINDHNSAWLREQVVINKLNLTRCKQTKLYDATDGKELYEIKTSIVCNKTSDGKKLKIIGRFADYDYKLFNKLIEYNPNILPSLYSNGKLMAIFGFKLGDNKLVQEDMKRILDSNKKSDRKERSLDTKEKFLNCNTVKIFYFNEEVYNQTDKSKLSPYLRSYLNFYLNKNKYTDYLEFYE